MATFAEVSEECINTSQTGTLPPVEGENLTHTAQAR